MEKYIELVFIQSTDNWYESDPEKWFTREEYRARQCTAKDLGPRGEFYMKEWAGYSLICPDIDAKDY